MYSEYAKTVGSILYSISPKLGYCFTALEQVYLKYCDNPTFWLCLGIVVWLGAYSIYIFCSPIYQLMHRIFDFAMLIYLGGVVVACIFMWNAWDIDTLKPITEYLVKRFNVTIPG